MNAVVYTVKYSYVASTKYTRQGTVSVSLRSALPGPPWVGCSSYALPHLQIYLQPRPSLQLLLIRCDAIRSSLTHV